MSRVTFQSSDSLVQKLFDTAEEKLKRNLKDFAGRTVLIEGGGYEKIWLETQPMGGEMYAKRDMVPALNNQLLFMECQRADGRIPGSIALIDGKITPQFNKFQGFCFPEPALNMYYLMGKDADYLELLHRTLRRFDEYLWKTRDSDGDGCLETWCKYDTGEDNAMRYMDAPDAWEEETPPKGCEAVPIASMDVMSYSYSCRSVLAEICRIAGKEDEAEKWEEKSRQVLRKMKDYLWDDEKGAYFDRDKHHKQMPVLIHNTLRDDVLGQHHTGDGGSVCERTSAQSERILDKTAASVCGGQRPALPECDDEQLERSGGGADVSACDPCAGKIRI